MNNAFAHILGCWQLPQDVYNRISDVTKQVVVDTNEFQKVREILRRDGSIKSYETQLYRKDKSLIWVSMSITAIQDSRGGVVYHGIVEDITPKKKLEEQRQASL